MKFKALIAILCSGCLMATASAHDESDLATPFYAGLGFGFTAADEDCDYYGYDCDGNDNSIKFFGGKRLHENFAIEVSYQDLGKIDNKLGSGVTTTAESEGINLSLVAIIPLEHIGYLYGKVGTMAWDTDYVRIDGNTRTSSDDDGTDMTFGFGFAATFQEKYEFRIEFERMNELDDRFTPGGDHITQWTLAGAINFH